MKNWREWSWTIKQLLKTVKLLIFLADWCSHLLLNANKVLNWKEKLNREEFNLSTTSSVSRRDPSNRGTLLLTSHAIYVWLPGHQMKEWPGVSSVLSAPPFTASFLSPSVVAGRETIFLDRSAQKLSQGWQIGETVHFQASVSCREKSHHFRSLDLSEPRLSQKQFFLQ